MRNRTKSKTQKVHCLFLFHQKLNIKELQPENSKPKANSTFTCSKRTNEQLNLTVQDEFGENNANFLGERRQPETKIG